jgi:hypothetical protein
VEQRDRARPLEQHPAQRQRVVHDPPAPRPAAGEQVQAGQLEQPVGHRAVGCRLVRQVRVDRVRPDVEPAGDRAHGHRIARVEHVDGGRDDLLDGKPWLRTPGTHEET